MVVVVAAVVEQDKVVGLDMLRDGAVGWVGEVGSLVALVEGNFGMVGEHLAVG